MPDTLTPFYELVLPEITGSPETWGNKLNDNFSELDTLVRDLRNYVQNAEPIGIVKMWAGLVSAVPANHAYCDGSIVNGVQTPDLRERFIVGGKTASDLFEPGDFGGATTHDHGGTTGGTIITHAQMPVHRHLVGPYAGADDSLVSSYGYILPEALSAGSGPASLVDGPTYTSLSQTINVQGFTSADVITTMGGSTIVRGEAMGNPHSHVVAAGSSLPPYYTLAFIMRVSYPWT